MSEQRFSDELLNLVQDKRLLDHPFYKAWDCGDIDQETLKTYARQYYQHVSAFPRYISSVHSLCESLECRQTLLENLCDEEIGEKNHPELWARFAEGLGVEREELNKEKRLPYTAELIDTFRELCGSSYAEGIASLFIYEEQTPAICETKIKGLVEHFGLSDERSLEYFHLHHTMDIQHTAESAALVDKLPLKERQKARHAARETAEALWNFLDGMEELRQESLGHTH